MRTIPVVILTTSDAERHHRWLPPSGIGICEEAWRVGGFRNVMKEISEYWFVICKLPP